MISASQSGSEHVGSEHSPHSSTQSASARLWSASVAGVLYWKQSISFVKLGVEMGVVD
jgi:hypothetical protein